MTRAHRRRMKLPMQRALGALFVVLSLVPIMGADCAWCPPNKRTDQCFGSCEASPDCGTGNVCDNGQCTGRCVGGGNTSGVVCNGDRPVCTQGGHLDGICACDA